MALIGYFSPPGTSLQQKTSQVLEICVQLDFRDEREVFGRKCFAIANGFCVVSSTGDEMNKFVLEY